MSRRGLVLACVLAALDCPAASCPGPPPGLLLHSCTGGTEAALLLLPEDGVPAGAAGQVLLVTGAYTATDRRPGDLPKPVGLFVHGGRVVNPNLGRMDGVLVIDPAGRPSLHHRARVPLAGALHDLTDPAARAVFAGAAAAAGLSVMQSHLLIVDGQVDVRPQEDAPRFLRRILFTDAGGFGLWQSRGAVTLHEAAETLLREHAPRMALNLDMGSYDYCWRLGAGIAEPCGLLGLADTGRLSNLLRFRLDPG